MKLTQKSSGIQNLIQGKAPYQEVQTVLYSVYVYLCTKYLATVQIIAGKFYFCMFSVQIIFSPLLFLENLFYVANLSLTPNQTIIEGRSSTCSIEKIKWTFEKSKLLSQLILSQIFHESETNQKAVKMQRLRSPRSSNRFHYSIDFAAN